MDGGHPSCGGDGKVMPGLSWLWRGLSGLGNTGVAKQVTLSLARAWFVFGPDVLGENTPSALPGVSLLRQAAGQGPVSRGLRGAKQAGMSQLSADQLRSEQQHQLSGAAAQSTDQ